MANSPAHRFGQIIGDLLETATIEFVKETAQQYQLFLDHRHPRKARNGQSEVRWMDIDGNLHKLDVVLETDGTEYEFGTPRAFIEVAWRRYTKHSKNKAQEIAGAIRPLVQRFEKVAPFYGAVIAGEFTDNSIKQLKSEGFSVVYFDYESMRKVFLNNGIDIIWEEDTPDSVLQERVDQYDSLSDAAKKKIVQDLIQMNSTQIDAFVSELKKSLDRKIMTVSVTPIFGSTICFSNMEDTINFIEQFDDSTNVGGFIRFELRIDYNNGDYIDSSFKNKKDAIGFINMIFMKSPRLGQIKFEE